MKPLLNEFYHRMISENITFMDLPGADSFKVCRFCKYLAYSPIEGKPGIVNLFCRKRATSENVNEAYCCGDFFPDLNYIIEYARSIVIYHFNGPLIKSAEKIKRRDKQIAILKEKLKARRPDAAN